MKRYLVILCALLASFPLKAHFIAYLEWFNPCTGQILETFVDVHKTLNYTYDLQQQQQSLLARAKKYHDEDPHNGVLVLVEDRASTGMQFEDTALCKQEIPKFIQANQAAFLSKTPILWLYAHCFLQGIPVTNIEIRKWHNSMDEITPEEEKEYKALLESFTKTAVARDAHSLESFYALLDWQARRNAELSHHLPEKPLLQAINPQLAWALTRQEFHYKAYMLDAIALNALVTSTHKRILLAAGGLHIFDIASQLPALGWHLKRIVLPSVPDLEYAKKLENFMIYSQSTQSFSQVYLPLEQLSDFDVNSASYFVDLDQICASECTPKKEPLYEIVQPEFQPITQDMKDWFFITSGKEGRLDNVQHALSIGANPQAVSKPYKDTALIGASRAGHLNVVQFLVDSKADVNGLDGVGYDALHYAWGNDHHEVVRLLWENGATGRHFSLNEAAAQNRAKLLKVCFDLKKENTNKLLGDGPLHRASFNGRIEATQVLLDAGMDPNQRDAYEDTPLLIAVRYGFDNLAQLLLDHNADVTTMNSAGETAQSMAFQPSTQKIVADALHTRHVRDRHVQQLAQLAITGGDRDDHAWISRHKVLSRFAN